MATLNNWTLADLKLALNDIDKILAGKEKWLGKENNFYLINGKLYTIDRLREVAVKDIKDKKTGKARYTTNQLDRIKRIIQDRDKIRKRRSKLYLAIIRRVLGGKYYNKTIIKDKTIIKESNYESTNARLKNRVLELAKERGLKEGETVPQRTIEFFYRKVKKEGLTKSKTSQVVRTTLNRAGHENIYSHQSHRAMSVADEMQIPKESKY